MKKKSLLLLMTALLCFQLTACGDEGETEEKESKVKTEESKEVEESKDSESENEETKDAQETDATEKTVEEVVEEAPAYYLPKQEIIDAEFLDFKFQVDDDIIEWPVNMTLGEYMETLPEYYHITDGKKDITPDRLIEPGEGMSVYFTSHEKASDAGFYAVVRNFTEQTTSIKDCPVVYLSLVAVYEGDVYLAKGVPANMSVNRENPLKLSEDERFTFANVRATMESFGIPEKGGERLDDHCGEYYCCFTSNNDLEYNIYCLRPEGAWICNVQGAKVMIHYPCFRFYFELSKETGTVKRFYGTTEYVTTSWVNPEDYGFSPVN